MELVKLEGVHFTYPKRTRAADEATVASGGGELDDEPELGDLGEERAESGRPGRTVGPVHALRGIDLRVSAGESVALLGHADSGRSTLLEIIAGTLRPTEGAAWLRGWATGLIAAGAGFMADATLHDNVIRNGLLMGVSRHEIGRIAADIIEFAGLTDRADERLRVITRPESRRLATAVALHVTPTVFLADDPVAFGNAEQREQTLDRLADERDADRALIIVANKSDVVKRLADRVVILREGQVAFDGPAREGLRRFRQPPTSPVVEDEQ